MVFHSCIINYPKMYKILDEVINFIEKTMKTWRVQLVAGGKSLVLSPLLFIIAMMPLNRILRKCTAGYKCYILLCRIITTQ